MERIVLSVKREGDPQSRDLEVPGDMPVGRLASLISRGLGWDLDANGRPVQYEIAAQPPGRLLRPDETLEQAGVWDGAWLIFSPVGAQALQPGVEGPMGGLVRSWQPLSPAQDTQQPLVDAPDRPASMPGAWKQLD